MASKAKAGRRVNDCTAKLPPRVRGPKTRRDPPVAQTFSASEYAALQAFAQLVLTTPNYTMFQVIDHSVAALPPATQDASRRFDFTGGSGPYWSALAGVFPESNRRRGAKPDSKKGKKRGR